MPCFMRLLRMCALSLPSLSGSGIPQRVCGSLAVHSHFKGGTEESIDGPMCFTGGHLTPWWEHGGNPHVRLCRSSP